jgi:hypothetical protein
MRILILLPIVFLVACKSAVEVNKKVLPLSSAQERELQKFTNDLNEALIIAAGNQFIFASGQKRLPDEIQLRRNACEESANGQKVGPRNCPFWSEWSSMLVGNDLEEFKLEMQIFDRNFQEVINLPKLKINPSLRSIRRRGDVVSTISGEAEQRNKQQITFNSEFSGSGSDLGVFQYKITIEMADTIIEAEFDSANNFGYINGKPYDSQEFDRLIPILRFN